MTVPFPNTRLIPADLPQTLAGTVRAGMTALVRLRPPDQVATRDTDTGRTTFAAAAAYYDGPARVQARGGAGPAGTPADRQVASGGYLVAVPHTVTQAAPGHLVEVYDAEQDPALVGLVLVVDDVPAATVILQRNLSCTRHQGSTLAS